MDHINPIMFEAPLLCFCLYALSFIFCNNLSPSTQKCFGSGDVHVQLKIMII